MPRTYKSKPGPKAKTDAQDLSVRVQLRVYRADLERIDELIAAGYAGNRSEVIRRSLEETAQWTLAPRRQRR